MKTQNKQHRQGDVLIKYVDSLPKKLKPILRQGGRLILANGASGHSHYIEDPKTELSEGEDGARFLNVKGEAIKGRFPIIERNARHVLVRHPKLGEIAFHPADVAATAKIATVDGYFAPLYHAASPVEHHTQMLPRGLAEQLDQSEYNEEEVRRVTD